MPFGPVNAPGFYLCMMDNFKKEWDAPFIEIMESYSFSGAKVDGKKYTYIMETSTSILIGFTVELNLLLTIFLYGPTILCTSLNTSNACVAYSKIIGLAFNRINVTFFWIEWNT